MMTTLTPQQIRHLSALMDARIIREIDEIRAVSERTIAERDQGATADWIDVAAAQTLLAADEAVMQQDVQDVRDIMAARGRLSAGTYGSCIDCSEAIAYERLLVYPTAKRCVRCQRVYEQGKAFGRILRVS